MVTFTTLQVGDKFHTGKSAGMGFHKNVVSWEVWEKISKSQARCVAVHGQIRHDFVGRTDKFAPFYKVYVVQETAE